MDGACNAHEGDEKRILNFAYKTSREEVTWNT